jgi:hypothetical protein
VGDFQVATSGGFWVAVRARLISELPNAIDWPIPEKYGKDPGEAFKKINLKHWIETGLKSHSTLNIKHSSNPGERTGKGLVI